MALIRKQLFTKSLIHSVALSVIYYVIIAAIILFCMEFCKRYIFWASSYIVYDYSLANVFTILSKIFFLGMVPIGSILLHKNTPVNKHTRIVTRKCIITVVIFLATIAIVLFIVSVQAWLKIPDKPFPRYG